jgi:hypothetical protein
MLPNGCSPDRNPDLLRPIIGTRTGLSIITYVMSEGRPTRQSKFTITVLNSRRGEEMVPERPPVVMSPAILSFSRKESTITKTAGPSTVSVTSEIR